MTDRARFDAIRARALKANERREAFEDTMRRKYGESRPAAAWLTKSENDKRDAIDRAQAKAWDDMHMLLARISPRPRMTRVASWWVAEKLTFEDAVTTGALSVTPQAGYGTSAHEINLFAAVVTA